MSKKDKSKGKKKFTGQISIIRARKILEALGFKTASGWDEAQLTKKIRNLPVLADGALLEPKMQKQVNTICNAIKKGTPEVFVVDLSDEAADKKRAAEVVDAVARVAVKDEEKKVGKAKKEAKADKKKDKEEKVKEEAKKAVDTGDKKKAEKKVVTVSDKKSNKDALGSRIGSQANIINKCLSKKSPITIEEIAKQTKLSVSRISGHLSCMKREGKVLKTTKGVKLA